MYLELSKTIEVVATYNISTERKAVLKPLIDYIKGKIENQQEVRLNLI